MRISDLLAGGDGGEPDEPVPTAVTEPVDAEIAEADLPDEEPGGETSSGTELLAAGTRFDPDDIEDAEIVEPAEDRRPLGAVTPPAATPALANPGAPSTDAFEASVEAVEIVGEPTPHEPEPPTPPTAASDPQDDLLPRRH